MPKDHEVSRVKELWGSTRGEWRLPQVRHWVALPKVQIRINFLATGDYRRDRYQYFLEKYFGWTSDQTRPRRHVLTLGCGHGDFERGLAKYHFARQHDAIDLADGAIEAARRHAADAGLSHVRYMVGNLNSIELPPCTYDAIFGISSVHHVSNLEHLFHQVAVALKPGAFLFLDEYVGPNQLQWRDAQLEVINREIQAMPERLRRSVIDGSIKRPIWRDSIETINSSDPSEAIRSEDILKVLPDYLDVIEVRGYGGSLLHMLLDGIAGNFNENDPEAKEWLDRLFEVEDRLLASGQLNHDFATIIARRKPTRVQKVFGRHAAYVVTRARASWRRAWRS